MTGASVNISDSPDEAPSFTDENVPVKPARGIGLFLGLSIAIAVLAAALVFGGIVPPFAERVVDEADYGPPALAYDVVSFSALPGWRAGAQSEAAPAFVRSCARLDGLVDDAPANDREALGKGYEGLSLAGLAGDWRKPCAAARALAAAGVDGAAGVKAARDFFEEQFRPLKITAVRQVRQGAPARRLAPLTSDTGLLTGYFEPVYRASLQQTDEFSAPLYARPDDLVVVDLGAFREGLAGTRIAGFVEGGALHPYPDHHAISAGAISARARVIAWLDPNDLLFLQIQGSGRLALAGGGELRVGFDGQNGQPYTAIGRVLVEQGVMKPEDVSMQSIRAFLASAPEDAARRLREANASYVFFRVLDDLADPALGPLGAGGAQLTPGRSLAVDRRYYPLGAPVWVSGPDDEPFRRLYIAQDEGGAIRGPLRGDIFFGAGDAAGEKAGAFKAEGAFYMLVPKAVAQRLLVAKAGAAS